MQMAAQPNPNHENGKTADRREERFKIHAAGNGSGSVLIFGCCALVAAGIGAAFAARRARNAQRKSDHDRRIGRVEDGMRGIEIERNLEESEGTGDSSKESSTERVRAAELSLDRAENSNTNFEIRPRLEVKGFDQEKENPSIRVCEEESESSQEIEGDKGEEGLGGTDESSLESSTQVRFDEEIISVKLDEEETESSKEAEGEKGEERSEGTGDSSKDSNREQISPAEFSLDQVEDSDTNFEIRPSLEVEVFNQKEDRSIELHEEESESSLDIEGDRGEVESEETGESSIEFSMEQVWPEEMQHTEPETPVHILDTDQVGDDDSIHLQTPHINPIEVKPMPSEEVIEHITKEDETSKQTGAYSIQSSCAFADCIQQEEVLADDLVGVKEMLVPSLASREIVENSDVDTDMNMTEKELDNDVKDEGSQVEELGLYCFNESSKVLSDDLENANIEQDEKTLIKSAERDREVPVKEEDLRGEEGSKLNDEAIHPLELKNVSVSINDKSVVALAETEYDGKTSAALDKYLHYNPGQGVLSVDISTEIQAVETLVTQSISKNSEMVKELGAKMDNDDCVAKEFSMSGVISYMFQDQEKPVVVQESSEQFQEENELFTKVGRGIEGLEVIQDSSMESSTEEVFPENEELSSIEWKEVEQVDVPKSTDNTIDVPKSTNHMGGLEQVKEEHGVIQETSMESSAEKESSSINLKIIEEVEASKRTDDMVSIEQIKEGNRAEDADVIQDSSTKSSAEEILPYHDKELPSIDFKNNEQVETVKRTDDVVGIEQAEEHEECKQKVAREVADDSSSEIQAIETLVTQSISKNSEMVKELGAKLDNDDRLAKEFSTIGVTSYMIQDQEKPGVIQESSEQFQEEGNELFTEVGRGIEGSEVIQDSSTESSAEEVFPEKEGLSIEWKEVEQVDVPKSTDDTVGIEQVKEEHGVIKETSMELSAEKESSPIDLKNMEEVEASKRTDDIVSIEQVKEGDGAEDADVVQDSSSESSAEEIFPYHDKELPSNAFKNTEQVEAVKRTDDVVGIEQAEEEHKECKQKVASEVMDASSSEIQAIETLVTQSISKNSEMIKELGAKLENDDRVAKEFSTIGVVSYMFQDQENPEVIQESLEQFQAEENEIFTEVGRGIEGSEAIQDSAMESRAEEIFPEKEKEELPSIESKIVELVEVPKSTDDTVGIEQVKEEHGAIQESSMGSSAEKESPLIDLQNFEQVEATKRTDDMISIEQTEEGDEAEDADVTEDSSTASSTDESITDQDKELPSIDFNNIKQVKAVKRANDVFGIEHAEEEYEACEQRVATKVDVLLMSSNYRFFIMLFLALGVALGLLTFAQPDSLCCRNHSLPEMYQKLYQLFFRSYRAVVDI